MDSLFSLAATHDEPYLTRVMAFVLKSDARFCNHFVAAVLGDADAGKVKEVVPEAVCPDGRPDIVLVCENHDVAIENKIGAAFGRKQIRRYRKEFGNHVYLLFKYVSDHKQAMEATRALTWHEVAAAVEGYLEQVEEDYPPEKAYLLGHFIRYLKEQRMAVGKVEKELVAGVKALANLTCQLEEALERESTATHSYVSGYQRKTGTRDYHGWQVNVDDGPTPFFVYVFYDPFVVFSYWHDESNLSQGHPEYEKLSEVHPQIQWPDQWHIATFDFATGVFFDETVDSQIRLLQKFVRDSATYFVEE